MSVINYRDWEIWLNQDYFANPDVLSGQFVFLIAPTLMARQTVEFVFEQIETNRRNGTLVTGPVAAYLSPLIHPRPVGPDGPLLLYKVDRLDTAAPVTPTLDSLLEELQALSLCLDFALTCHQIEYEIPPGQATSGTAFVARRKAMARGVAFEVDERTTAADNLRHHFTDYRSLTDQEVLLAANHYRTGLTLLGLEDQYPGLLDAAFMQFYQGCETLLLRAPGEKITDAKKRIAADPKIRNARDMQIVAAHVWKVRNDFFGHGGATMSRSAADAYQVAKQVLVARWLCRRLIDIRVGVADGLCREMRLYHAGGSDAFGGSVTELETAFAIPGPAGKAVEIFDAHGSGIERYVRK